MRGLIVSLCVMGLAMMVGCGQNAETPVTDEKPAMVDKQEAAVAEPVVTEPVVAAGAEIWKTDFDSTEGWYDLKTDPTYMASITAVAGGKAKIQEAGSDKWGKVAFVFENIDFSKGPYLTLVVDSLDPESAFAVGVDSKDWNDFKKLRETTNVPGTYEIDLAATGWTGIKTFNLLLIVEGDNKSFTVDQITLGYKQ